MDEDPEDPRPLVRADHIARACGVSSRHVLKLAADGTLRPIRLGKRAICFVPSEVEETLGLPPGIIQRVLGKRRGFR